MEWLEVQFFFGGNKAVVY